MVAPAPGKHRPGVLSWLYRKLGKRYLRLFLAVELQTAYPVIIGTFALFSFYYRGSFGDFALLAGVCCALAAVSISVAYFKSVPLLAPIDRWMEGRQDEDSTAQAWAAAVSFPWRMIRNVSLLPLFVVVLPSSVISVLWLELSWLAMFPFIGASLVSLGYASMLHYLALEIGLRPVLVDINQQVTPRRRADVSALPMRWRLLAALPLINLITGLTVAALTSDEGGGADLGLDVLIALGVATTVALELTVLLSRSVLQPIDDLKRATDALARGDYEIQVPVTRGDEFGELAASFNGMVAGLAERERIRDAFGTYLDHEVAEYILSDGYAEEGVEVEVSVLFCDVRDFTSFAAEAGAQRVVAALNRLFEVVVPIIARHGGHIDKFEGDGLLAVFGAPRPYPDHADRAVRAACEIAQRVNAKGEAGELRVGVGVNSGRVVAGAIGGAGRLNFSVIGDPVNVASRVEGVTRNLHESVLITPETRARLGSGFRVESVGRHELRGIEEPLELFAPRAGTTRSPTRSRAEARA